MSTVTTMQFSLCPSAVHACTCIMEVESSSEKEKQEIASE